MTFDPRRKAVADIQTALLLDMVVDLNRALVIGDVGLGRRVLFGSAGGSFEGPKLRGEVLPGAGDWALSIALGTVHERGGRRVRRRAVRPRALSLHDGQVAAKTGMISRANRRKLSREPWPLSRT
jgi:hypothetical protein